MKKDVQLDLMFRTSVQVVVRCTRSQKYICCSRKVNGTTFDVEIGDPPEHT